MKAHSLPDLIRRRKQDGRPYLEFERADSMSLGLYVLGVGAKDEQEPHAQDEVYVVVEGSGRFTADGETRQVEPGDTIFVPAGVDHRFHDITRDLRLIVVFAPPEGSRPR